MERSAVVFCVCVVVIGCAFYMCVWGSIAMCTCIFCSFSMGSLFLYFSFTYCYNSMLFYDFVCVHICRSYCHRVKTQLQ
jgi:hypothetical protein